MHSKKTLLIAQLLISAMMAFLMTGYASALSDGLVPGFVTLWLTRFVTAWPVAFVLSLLVGPLAFRLAAVLTKPRRWG